MQFELRIATIEGQARRGRQGERAGPDPDTVGEQPPELAAPVDFCVSSVGARDSKVTLAHPQGLDFAAAVTVTEGHVLFLMAVCARESMWCCSARCQGFAGEQAPCYQAARPRADVLGRSDRAAGTHSRF